MTRPNGLHHLAISTGDIRRQISFFCDVLGMELVALYWMHGVKGAWHGFLRLNDRSSIAFVQTPQMASIAPQFGVSHAGNAGAPSAPGTMQHLALDVDDDDQLIAMRDRIRTHGVNVIGPIDHGFCKSIYFAGPEHLTLEISTSRAAIDPDAWIDPEVVALAGISADELARFRAPASYTGQGGTVPQPPIDPAQPHMRYPQAAYRKLIEMPDDVMTATRSETQPPVQR
jgi:catechol 2,3-dioxygenase-like lactoylglutathione lyase family enzyme